MQTTNDSLIRDISVNNIEDQQKLNDLVIRKIEQKIGKGSANVQETLQRLETEGKIMRDFVVPIGAKYHSENVGSEISFSANGKVKMHLKKSDQDFSFNEHSLIQIGAKYQVPGAYLKFLFGTDWGRTLAAEILNNHSSNVERERVLIRTVGGNIRGVLSDSYRRLDSTSIVRSFINALGNSGAQLCDGTINETKVFLEAIIPTPVKIETPKNGIVYIAFGVQLRNSDYGDGSLQLRSFLMQGACLNGAVLESVMKQVHLGGRLPEDLQLSENTYKLDTRTQASAINDLTGGLLSAGSIKTKANKILQLSEFEVDMQKEIKMLPKAGLLKEEAEEVGKIIYTNKADDGVQGESTLWKLTQGITAMARTKEATRQRELQEIAGSLMTDRL